MARKLDIKINPVHERFPESHQCIVELQRLNQSFMDLCADYSEVVEVLRRAEDGKIRHTPTAEADLHRLQDRLLEELKDFIERPQ